MIQNLGLLSEKKIVVASGKSAIGQVIVLELLKQGATVINLGKHPDIKFETKCQERFFSYDCDLTAIEQLEQSLRPIIEEHNPFEGFVFADGLGGVRPLALTKPSFMLEMMRANVLSFVELTRLLTKKNVLNCGGSIIALSSVSSIKGLKSKIAYSAAKAALDASVRAMAAELADKKIRVNSIQKGWVTSDMQSDFIQNNLSISSENDFGRQLLGAIEPEEIAHTMVFLLSDASKSITGTAILVDGGYSL